MKFFMRRWGGKREDAEDFGSFCVERWLRGRHFSTDFEYLAIDFIRAKPKFVEELPRDETTSLYEVSILDALDSFDRALLVLSSLWGMSENEIAHVFGLSASNVSKLKGAAIFRLRKATV